MKLRNVAVFDRLLIAVYKNYGSTALSTYRNFSSKAVDISYSEFQPQKMSNVSPILIMHGFLGSKLNWRGLSKAIVKKCDRQVYTLDARNHGDSPHSSAFSYNLMSEDVKQLMVKESISKAILIGHSMGGRTAMNLALNEKHLVEKLVVVDVSPIKMPESSSVFIPAYMSAMKEAISSVQGLGIIQARKIVNEYLSKSIPEEPIRQFLLTNLLEKDDRIVWKANIDVLEKTFQSEICDFSSFSGCFMEETLFICGGGSPYVKEEDYPSIRRMFPKAEFVVIPGAGHWVHSERPSEFLEVLCKFL